MKTALSLKMATEKHLALIWLKIYKPQGIVNYDGGLSVFFLKPKALVEGEAQSVYTLLADFGHMSQASPPLP